jgi:RNA polymerase sigma-70 factor (ECF subfamily)
MTRALVERAQRGDHDAYEQLARGVSGQLLRVASRIVRDPDAAQDAVQQALVAMWRDLPSLRDPDRFEAWAYRLVVRACRSQSRHERSLGVQIVDLSEEMGVVRDSEIDVVLRDRLSRAFDALSIDHRTVVVLHHLVGLPLDEIAEILDVPRGTVGSRLHHALRAMRAAIEAAERPAMQEGQPA